MASNKLRSSRGIGRHRKNSNAIKFALCIVIMVLVGVVLVPVSLDSESTLPASNNQKGEDKVQVDVPDKKPQKELKHMWISYLDFQNVPKDKAGFETKISEMFDRCKILGMNSVIVQVRPDCDAMYPSEYFPWSKFASGKQGIDPGYDPLAYMIDAAHSRGLEFHAWVNPYRVTGYLMGYKELSFDNPAKTWMTDSDSANNRWAILHEQYVCLNPSIPEVRTLIVNGVKEIVEKYDVDGIHFDDYFYPTINDDLSTNWFDKPEYDASGSSLSIADWRRENVNMLVRDTYKSIKEIKPDVKFGISPSGSFEYLKSESTGFVDIEKWMTEPGYVDYIMPQIYWGFERLNPDGELAAYSYKANLKSWIKLKKKGDVELQVGYNMDNAGKNVEDGNTISEWLRHDDIIKRQLEMARATGEVSGYAFFRYELFQRNEAQNELYNLIPLLTE